MKSFAYAFAALIALGTPQISQAWDMVHRKCFRLELSSGASEFKGMCYESVVRFERDRTASEFYIALLPSSAAASDFPFTSARITTRDGEPAYQAALPTLRTSLGFLAADATISKPSACVEGDHHDTWYVVNTDSELGKSLNLDREIRFYGNIRTRGIQDVGFEYGSVRINHSEYRYSQVPLGPTG